MFCIVAFREKKRRKKQHGNFINVFVFCCIYGKKLKKDNMASVSMCFFLLISGKEKNREKDIMASFLVEAETSFDGVMVHLKYCWVYSLMLD